MRPVQKILAAILVAALLYGLLAAVEKMTTQELTRISHPATEETVCLMWKPQYLRGGGLVSLDLRDRDGRLTGAAPLGSLDTAFNALQRYGQLSFDGQTLTTASLQTGETARRFVLRDGKFHPAE